VLSAFGPWQVLLFNMPPTFSQILAFVMPILNPRMRGKIRPFRLGTPFLKALAPLSAAAICSWGTQARHTREVPTTTPLHRMLRVGHAGGRGRGGRRRRAQGRPRRAAARGALAYQSHRQASLSSAQHEMQPA
jgi:hypothetical protein